MKGSKKYLSQNLLSDFLAVFGPIPGGLQRRHRHRYEFNNAFREQFEEAGFVFSGVSPDNRLVEIVEIPENKFFVACQYHPELSSRPNRPEELYTAFVTAAVENSN